MGTLRRATVFGIALTALAFTAPQVSQAQIQVIDFSGSLTQEVITFGTLLPPGFQIPGTFTGSFQYDPTSSRLISNVLVISEPFK
jgi:hypothetical protein